MSSLGDDEMDRIEEALEALIEELRELVDASK